MNLRSSRVYTAPVPKMPPGLVELMEGLARDVLKNNPTDVYAFCADHMQKLLQIRDGSTTKNVPTLKQKIVFATKKVRDRAAQRRDEFDKKMQVLRRVQTDNFNEAEQYIQQNIVKISQNHLTCDTEHEIIAGLAKENFMPSEKVQDTDAQIVDASSDTNAQDNECLQRNELEHEVKLLTKHNIEKIAEQSSEIELSSKNNDKNSFEEKNIVNLDKVITSEDVQNKKNVLKQQEILEKEQSNAINSNNINNSITLLRDENVENNHLHDTLESSDKGTTESIECKQVGDLSNVEIVNVEINNEEYKENQKEHDSTEVQRNLEGDYSKIDGIKSGLDSKSRENNDKSTEEKHGNEKAFENNVVISEVIGFENNLEQNNERNMDAVDNNKYSDLTGHVHNSSMDLETAAITIQKVFRSFLFRNKTLSVDDPTNIDINLLIEDKKDDEAIMSNNNANKDRRPLGVNRMDTVLQTVNEEKSLSLSTDDSSTLSSAATIIQAHVRGFLVRNNYNNNKTVSSTSGIDSDAQSTTSLECDNDNHRNKTVLNIHIVPEGGHFMSRDESIITSMDLSVDGSPPSSTNLHPLGYDKSERRKLKREDAIQSISPPSCNSGKLSEDIDSVKEVMIDGNDDNIKCEPAIVANDNVMDMKKVLSASDALNDDNISTVVDTIKIEEDVDVRKDNSMNKSYHLNSSSQMTSDEMDVVTPHVTSEETMLSENVENNIKLMHSGEFHDVVLPTKVSRNDTSVVREFQNVLVYFLLWNNS
ncbi:unnamed protein product [Euphydryas editha]|uniref:RIIa domain-containing protein n=1 Tax=Euphydryas editha TaxID=104508 RepID=A0AAU9UA77_EUPED|nr:unnamed protein product [Euphydryas editha]